MPCTCRWQATNFVEFVVDVRSRTSAADFGVGSQFTSTRTTTLGTSPRCIASIAAGWSSPRTPLTVDWYSCRNCRRCFTNRSLRFDSVSYIVLTFPVALRVTRELLPVVASSSTRLKALPTSHPDGCTASLDPDNFLLGC